MPHKPSLTRALDTAADIARQIGRDPAVKEATADLLQNVGRKLADKVDQGANQLRARNQVHVPVDQPAPSLGKSTRRVGLALADAMVRSSASREKASRPAARPTTHRHGGIENEILQHAEDTYQQVMARFDEPDEASLRHDLPVSPSEVEEDARAWAQLAAETNTPASRSADTLTQEPDEADRQEPVHSEHPAPSLSTAEAEEDARAWAQLATQASALPAAAIGAAAPGDSHAARNRRPELPGDDHWRAELR